MIRQFTPPQHKNIRSDCAWVLFEILENGRSSRDCLSKVQRRHGPKDNAWIQEMTMGVLRQLPTLQQWLRQLLENPLKGKKKILEHLLLLGMYQIAFTRVSPHAAVSETVNAASYLGSPSLKGLINAILRNFQRQELQSVPVQDPVIASGLPKWLYKAIEIAYPGQAETIIQQTNAVAPVWLRVNTRVVSRQAFTEALDAQGMPYTCPASHPAAVVLTRSGDVTALPGFDKGWFAVQDGAAQLCTQYLAAEPGERILDCCAAPGGKTGHIIELQPHISACIALDSDKSRLARVNENMARLGHSPSVVHADAADRASWWDGKPFDRILLDAPCSATGVIRRHPDIRWNRKPSDIDTLVSLQKRILDALWPTLKSGGTLLYATCSILPAENTQQIAQFLAENTDATLQPITENETDLKPGRQIIPGEDQMDGFYMARLIKS